VSIFKHKSTHAAFICYALFTVVFPYIYRLAKEVYGTTVPNQDLNLNQDLFVLYARGNAASASGLTPHGAGPSNRGATATVNFTPQTATAATTVGGATATTASLLCLFISSVALFLKV